MAVVKFLDSYGNVAWAENGKPITEHGNLLAALKRNNNKIEDHTKPTPLGAENERRKAAGEDPLPALSPEVVATRGTSSGSRGHFPTPVVSVREEAEAEGLDSSTEKKLQELADDLARTEDALRKVEAERFRITTALDERRVTTGERGADVAEVDTIGNLIEGSSRPSPLLAMFGFRRGAGAQIPIPPALATAIQGYGIPGYGNLPGNELIGMPRNTLTPEWYQEVANRLMSAQDRGNIRRSPELLEQALAIAGLAGINRAGASELLSNRLRQGGLKGSFLT